MYKYSFRIQFMMPNLNVGEALSANSSELKEKAEALHLFCRSLDLKFARHERFHDMYYVEAPATMIEFAHMSNAITAFCHVHSAVWRVEYGRTTLPVDDFLRMLAGDKPVD